MIVFELICREQHRFEGWFASGEDFNAQQSRGLLNCPVCGGVHVEKVPVAKIRKQGAEVAVAEPGSAARPAQTQHADVSRLIDYVLTHTDDVGRKFVEEARRIHYREAPQRSIRGVASRSETEALQEEGVPVFTLPVPPQDRWN